MKKAILLLAVLSCFSAISQTCKYSINEIDKFTGLAAKQTKQIRIMKKFDRSSSIALQHYGEEYYFIIALGYGSLGQVGNIDIKKDFELTLLLSNNEKITLKCYKDRNGVVANHGCSLSDVFYLITPDQLKSLMGTTVTDIRYRRIVNGSEGNENFGVDEKYREDIQELVKCIL